MFYSIIYQSKAKEDFTAKDIELMLIKAKRNNKEKGITGCIVFCDNKFIQIIEGEKDAVTDLYAEIKLDKRHYSVTTLIASASKNTLWDEWSMAFYKFSNNFEQNKYSRMLLENYFESARSDQKASDTFLILKKSILELIADKF